MRDDVNNVGSSCNLFKLSPRVDFNFICRFLNAFERFCMRRSITVTVVFGGFLDDIYDI